MGINCVDLYLHHGETKGPQLGTDPLTCTLPKHQPKDRPTFSRHIQGKQRDETVDDRMKAESTGEKPRKTEVR